MIDEQHAAEITSAYQSAHRCQIEDRNFFRIDLAFTLGKQKTRAGGIQPFSSIFLIVKASINLKHLTRIGHTVHRPRQSSRLAVRRVHERQRIRRVFNEIISVYKTGRSQSNQSNGTIIGSIFTFTEVLVELGRRGNAIGNRCRYAL